MNRMTDILNNPSVQEDLLFLYAQTHARCQRITKKLGSEVGIYRKQDLLSVISSHLNITIGNKNADFHINSEASEWFIEHKTVHSHTCVPPELPPVSFFRGFHVRSSYEAFYLLVFCYGTSCAQFFIVRLKPTDPLSLKFPAPYIHDQLKTIPKRQMIFMSSQNQEKTSSCPIKKKQEQLYERSYHTAVTGIKNMKLSSVSP